MKNIIFLWTLIMGLSIIITNAEAQTQNSTQVNQTGITNYLEGFQGVSVLYESPTSLVLTLVDVATSGQALDYAKEKGYSIDAVTVFTETSQAFGSTRYLTPNYTVFMSK